MKIVVAMGVVAFGFVPSVVLAQASGINQNAAGLKGAVQGEMSRAKAHLAAPA